MKSRRAKRLTALALCLSALVAGTAAMAAEGAISGENSPPVAKNAELTTYRGVPVTGRLQATDPEGDAVTFRITAEPKYGSLEMTGEDAFIYTPEGRKGSDSFKYRALDDKGAASAEATVKITVKKQSSGVSYSDMGERPSGYAALRLAEEGIFTGDKLGDECFFRPEETVSRGEFLAMCMAAAGEKRLEGIEATGFADDGETPAWARSYVAAALLNGDVRGYEDETGNVVFSPERPVNYYEAAVMLSNIFGLSDAVSAAVVTDETCPAWAQAASNNLLSAGLKCPVSDKGAPLTREAAATMLTEAMDTVSARASGGLFSWLG